ncbi:MAG TPA: hypothetical protein VF131_02040 [Blastocatellia bacterium]|nr:hypothetical protein [Blastocatellia bacterium]
MQRQRKTNSFFPLATLAIVFTSILAMMPSHSQNASIINAQKSNSGKSESEKNQMPVVIFEAAETGNAAERDLRRLKGSRYDNRRPQPISEMPPGIEELPLNSHWSWQLSALPSSQSDAVVVGEVFSAQAYLSNDKTGVYSEFKVRITETLKVTNNLRLEAGDSIVAVREGGSVQFPSGRIQSYPIANQGMPSVGRRYVFFLKHNDQAQDFSILTGYQLRKGRSVPLDNLEMFSVYKGASESSFLNAVRESIARTAQGEGRLK